jgi:hypothetical protein
VPSEITLEYPGAFSESFTLASLEVVVSDETDDGLFTVELDG